MKRINIIRNGITTNSAQFETDEILQEWLSKHVLKETFGKAAYSFEQLVSEAVPAVYADREVLDAAGLSFDPPQFEIVETQAAQPAVYTTIQVPAEYTIEITDVTDELEQARGNAEAQAFLDSTDFKVLRHVGQQALGLATTLTSQEYLELEQERQMARSTIVK